MEFAMKWTGRGLLALALVVSTQGTACVDAPPDHGTGPAADHASSELATEPTDDLLADLEGTWQFVYTDARRAAVEEKLAATIDDAAALDEAKAEAEAEARASEVEFTADHRYVSRVHGEVVMMAKFEAKALDDKRLLMRPVGAEGMPSIEVTVEGDRLVMQDPAKGPLEFARK
jgi:hypothetical protein